MCPLKISKNFYVTCLCRDKEKNAPRRNLNSSVNFLIQNNSSFTGYTNHRALHTQKMCYTVCIIIIVTTQPRSIHTSVPSDVMSLTDSTQNVYFYFIKGNVTCQDLLFYILFPVHIIHQIFLCLIKKMFLSAIVSVCVSVCMVVCFDSFA